MKPLDEFKYLIPHPQGGGTLRLSEHCLLVGSGLDVFMGKLGVSKSLFGQVH